MKINRVLRILIQSVALTFCNLLSFFVAITIYNLFKWPNRVLSLALIAAGLCLVIFLSWNALVQRLTNWGFILSGKGDLLSVFFIPLFLGAILFIPLYDLTQGYPTGLANLIELWIFQPVNNYVILFNIYMGPKIHDLMPKD